jgi:hypothetical protein
MGSYYDYSDIYNYYSGGTTSVTWNLVSIALAILMIVAQWRIYGKAGERGWAALIPYYNSYVLYKVSGKKKLFWWFLVCSIVFIIATILFIVALAGAAYYAYIGMFSLSYNEDELAMLGMLLIVSVLVMAVTGIAMLVFRILQSIGLAKNFGVGGGYAVGLIFLPHIFYSILAFGSNFVYCGGNRYYAGGGYGMPGGYDPQTGQPYYNNYGQPQYDQQPYNQPQYDQQPYNQQQYGQQQYNQPQYGQQQYNQPQYGQQQYNQQQYDPSLYGQPGNNQQGSDSPDGTNTNL